ncbi:MAG: helix-hairpin-helix domain-containing protein [Deltaproteobacteria bacterium]
MLKNLVRSFLLALLLAVPAFARVDINTADQATLEAVKGLGPAKAAAIIEYRNAHGKFKSVDELTNVKGIGPKILEKIKDQVEVK